MTPLSFFGEETDEPSVIGWMPAAAVYFRDPDGHMLEYLAMLDEPPRPDAGITTWSDWVSGEASHRAAATFPSLRGLSHPRMAKIVVETRLHPTRRWRVAGHRCGRLRVRYFFFFFFFFF